MLRTSAIGTNKSSYSCGAHTHTARYEVAQLLQGNTSAALLEQAALCFQTSFWSSINPAGGAGASPEAAPIVRPSTRLAAGTTCAHHASCTAPATFIHAIFDINQSSFRDSSSRAPLCAEGPPVFMLVIAGLSHTTFLLTTILVQRKMMQRLRGKCQLFCTMLFIVSEKRLSEWNGRCHVY